MGYPFRGYRDSSAINCRSASLQVNKPDLDLSTSAEFLCGFSSRLEPFPVSSVSTAVHGKVLHFASRKFFSVEIPSDETGMAFSETSRVN